jgi:hypothetical protein
VFKKISIALSSDVKKVAQTDQTFRRSKQFQHAFQVPIDLVRCGLYGGSNGDPLDFDPVIGSTSAQGTEFADKIFAKCDRLTGYLYFIPISKQNMVIGVEVTFYQGRRAIKIFNFRGYEDGKFHQIK